MVVHTQSIAHTCNIKKHQSLFTDYLKKLVTLNQLQTPFRVDFRSFKVLESTPAHWFKCIYREFRRFSVCSKIFLDVLKLVKCNIYFRHTIDFPFHIYKSVGNANLNNIYCWIETTTWIKTEESLAYKFYYDTRDLSLRSL